MVSVPAGMGAFISPIADASVPSFKPAVYPRDTPRPTVFELDQMRVGPGVVYTGPEPISLPSGMQTPREQTSFDHSRPASPRAFETVALQAQTWNDPPMNKWRILGACFVCMGNGFNDSAPGALLPYMEKHWSIGYGTISLIFIANALGFIGAPLYLNALDRKLGRAWAVGLSDACMIIAYIAMVITPPFPVFAVAFFLVGLGEATSLSLNNVFCANTEPSTVVLGSFHGAYGLGGLIAPIIATSMVTRGILFSRFYTILIGVRLSTLIYNAWAFAHYERDNPPQQTLLPPTTPDSSHPQPAKSTTPNLLTALRSRTTLIAALFIFAYQGAEVSISGWVISYLISYRGSNPARVGYVTAGFWGGITVGRFLLTPLATRIGHKTSVYCLIAGSAAFQILLWVVPNVIAESVSVAFVGLLLGPIWPCVAVVASQLLPRSLQTTALSFISSAGSSGGAIAPFMIGLGSQAAGTWVLNPVCVGLYAVMAACWVALPKVQKRTV